MPKDDESSERDSVHENTPMPGAYYCLAVLTTINILNYTDRYIPSATKEFIIEEFNLSDAESGLSVFVFLLVYMVMSPVFGTLSDYGVSRKALIVFGITAWSLSAASACFAPNFAIFLVSRAFVGVGEASFVVITPSLLSDMFPPTMRNKVLTIFYAAIPVGSAIGFILGGVFSTYFGWRKAFLFTGLPGLIVAISVFWIRDPGQGTYEEETPQVSWKDALKIFWDNKIYVIITTGSILVTFGMGAIADWLPTYISRNVSGAGNMDAGLITGAATVVGGLFGTLLGGFSADQLKGRVNNPYMFTSFVGLGIGVCLCTIAIYVNNMTAVIISLAGGQIFLWTFSGPVNAVTANVMPASVRTRAFGFQLIMVHLLGDAISPSVIGKLSDVTGSLALAISLVPISIFLGGIIYSIGWKFFDENPQAISVEAYEEELHEVDSSGIVFSSVADVSTVEERSPPVSDVGPASTYLDSFSYQNNQTPISAESSDGADIASEIDLSYSL